MDILKSIKRKHQDLLKSNDPLDILLAETGIKLSTIEQMMRYKVKQKFNVDDEWAEYFEFKRELEDAIDELTYLKNKKAIEKLGGKKRRRLI